MGVILLHHYHYYHILVVYVPNTIKKRVVRVFVYVCVAIFHPKIYIFQYIRKLYEKQEQQRQHDNNFLAYFFILGYPTYTEAFHRSVAIMENVFYCKIAYEILKKKRQRN